MRTAASCVAVRGCGGRGEVEGVRREVGVVGEGEGEGEGAMSIAL